MLKPPQDANFSARRPPKSPRDTAPWLCISLRVILAFIFFKGKWGTENPSGNSKQWDWKQWVQVKRADKLFLHGANPLQWVSMYWYVLTPVMGTGRGNFWIICTTSTADGGTFVHRKECVSKNKLFLQPFPIQVKLLAVANSQKALGLLIPWFGPRGPF